MVTIKVSDRYKNILSNSKNYVGLMGISIGKPCFSNKQVMASYSQFIQDKFLYGIFLIADYPKKYNIMSLERVSEEKAKERTMIAGNDMKNSLEKITRNYPFVKVANWQYFMNPLYKHNLEVLRRAYCSDLTFQQLSNDIVKEFLNNSSNLAKWEDPNQPPISKAKDYLLDELALLISIPFSFPLPVCEIYPGRNELHEQVQERKFPFCKDLNIKDDRVFMEAHYEFINKEA